MHLFIVNIKLSFRKMTFLILITSWCYNVTYSSIGILYIILYFSFDPLGSVNIYEVFHFLYVKNHRLNSILIIWPLWEFESLI